MEETLHFSVGERSFQALISSEPMLPVKDDDLMLICDSDNAVRLFKASHGSMHPDQSKESQDVISILRGLHPLDLKNGDIVYFRLIVKETDDGT